MAFGLVGERCPKRTLMDKLRKRKLRPERYVTTDVFSNLQPKTRVYVNEKPIDLTLVRGEYSGDVKHQIRINRLEE